MPNMQIPQRNPIADIFHGNLFYVDNETKTQRFWFLGIKAPQGMSFEEGTWIIRYGVRYLGKPHISIVPGMVASDYGDILTGETAWEFIYKKGLVFPRADVLGYRNDGVDEMITMKYLDPAIPPQVLIYRDEQATMPLAPLVALITSQEEILSFPLRVIEYLPHYETLEDWKASQK